jgi:hypothetical protein
MRDDDLAASVSAEGHGQCPYYLQLRRKHLNFSFLVVMRERCVGASHCTVIFSVNYPMKVYVPVLKRTIIRVHQLPTISLCAQTYLLVL